MIDILTLLKQADCPNFLLQIQVADQFVNNDMTYYQCSIQVTWGVSVELPVDEIPTLVIKGTAEGYQPISVAVELTEEKMEQLVSGDTGLQLDATNVVVVESGLSAAAIIGIAVGAIALISIIIIVILAVKAKKKKQN